MQKMINPRFTRGEYWLLEAVAELAIPICWLDWVDLEIALNKTGHGMTRTFLVDTMQKLFSDGFIAAYRLDKPDEYYILTSEEIDKILDERQNNKEHYYCLTAKGGEYWEAFASPDWTLYINSGFGLPEENDIWEGELICMTKDHLENYFRSLRYYDYDVDENSIQWDTLKPWKATYWKELPVGYRMKFRCKEKEKTIDPCIPDPLNQLWYDSLWYQWR